MTHRYLVEIGFKWLSKKCGFVFKEFKTQNVEIPDLIGFKSNHSFVLEAKVSRNDFFKDKKKDFRKQSHLGMGDFRFFITPKNLISIDELPNMWGLIEVDENMKPRVKFNPFGKGNIYSNWKKNQSNKKAEYLVMYSALRRLENKGLIKNNI